MAFRASTAATATADAVRRASRSCWRRSNALMAPAQASVACPGKEELVAFSFSTAPSVLAGAAAHNRTAIGSEVSRRWARACSA